MKNQDNKQSQELGQIAMLYLAYRFWTKKSVAVKSSDMGYNIGFICAKLFRKLIK